MGVSVLEAISPAFRVGTRDEEGTDSLDHGPPVVFEADLQLLKDFKALLQLGSVSVGEGHVVNDEASLLVDVQQGRNSVLEELASGAENKYFLHPMVLELLCRRQTKSSLTSLTSRPGKDFDDELRNRPSTNLLIVD